MKRNGYSKLLWLLASIAVVILMGAAVTARAAFSDLNLVTAIQDVAKRVIPSVVHIEVTEKRTVTNPLLPFQNDPFFQYFFGNPKMPKKFEREITGLGSGILIDSQGHILTNSHLVNGATKMKVVLSDGRSYTDASVKVIGVDAKTDLAVIKISDRGNFPFVTFGDSDKVEVGQWVVAIGHPQGLDQTVTQGIISAKHRRGISDPSSYQDFLQTDAAINPGNSGGPLLNLEGEVIGVNAAIMSSSGGFEGIGFAIPGNMALHVSKRLMASGKVERGWLGLTIQNLTPELAGSFGMSSTKGVVVANVLKNGPAEKAGIKRGDIIVAYEQKPVEDPDRFRNELAIVPIGQSITLTTLRDGRSRDVNLMVSSDVQQGKALLSSVAERFGVEVKSVGKNEEKKYGLNDRKGVIVSRIAPNGSFGKAGVERDDIILQINQSDVDGPDQFGEVLSTTPPQSGLILTVIDHKSREAGMVRLTAP
ncbi:MAG: Do family serine endopeptidase [Syntrophobacteraceae bacterium]